MADEALLAANVRSRPRLCENVQGLKICRIFFLRCAIAAGIALRRQAHSPLSWHLFAGIFPSGANRVSASGQDIGQMHKEVHSQ